MALIEDYALLSDCHSAALVSKNGSIDWLCFPRFDSPACFAALLGTEENGRWVISPSGPFRSQRKYVDGTVVLETTFESDGGSCKLVDSMLVRECSPVLVRYLEGVKGEIEIDFELIIRFDYGKIVPWVNRLAEGRHGLVAIAGPEALILSSPIALEGKDLHTAAKIKLKAGEKLAFTLQWFQSFNPSPEPLENPFNSVRKTIYWWKEWSDRCEHPFRGSEAVKRSLLTLKALTYKPTGGIVAAPTTSLPESIGGNRNWDYRYCWLRDSTFTLYALLSAGYRDEARRWNQWLLRAVAGTPTQANIMYGITGERRLSEIELDWLQGYEGSKPVRIGNAAYQQTQLDVFGELMDTSLMARKNGLVLPEDSWTIETKMVEHLGKAWTEPDEGIWETRGPKRHFTHSKVMAWVAVDRAVKSSQGFGLKGSLDEWIELRDRIHRDVCENGFDTKLGSFIQYYGGNELDASLLMVSLVGFLPPTDPRIVGTVDAIQKNLVEDGMVKRYRISSSQDGLSPREGAFIACSFWLVDNLVLLKRRGEAQELYERLIALRNDVGLFSEEYCPNRKRMLGNFPQALSHIAHINSANNLGANETSSEARSS